MSIEKIEALTIAFAKQRTAVISDAASMQLELEAVHKRYAAPLREQVKALLKAQADLTAAIEANAALFPERAKTRVFEAIKVGFQKGKSRLLGVEVQITVPKLELLREKATQANDLEMLERIRGALSYEAKLSAEGLGKLQPHEMEAIGIRVLAGAQSVLIKPVDNDSFKAVEATIKAVMAETEDV